MNGLTSSHFSSFFYFYIIYFLIFQRYIPQKKFADLASVASSTGGKSLSPDEPAIASLQYSNRRLIRQIFLDLGSSLSKNHN